MNWEKTGLLDGVKNRKDLAVLLENQRLYNETKENPYFRRIALPIIRRIFNDNMKVGVFGWRGSYTDFPCELETNLSIDRPLPEISSSGLDNEAERVRLIAEDLKEFIEKQPSFTILGIGLNDKNEIVVFCDK
jgi:hypothetical protein